MTFEFRTTSLITRQILVVSLLLSSLSSCSGLAKFHEFIPFSQQIETTASGDIVVTNGVPFRKLSNKRRIPMVGLGVERSRAEHVDALVAEAMKDDSKTILIDTSHVSENEHLVAEGLVYSVENNSTASPEGEPEKVEVHVVTKVWYTHLGYDRTKASFLESIQDLSPALRHSQIDLQIHVLLSWPRCYDSVEWMDCAGEEAALPPHIRAVGPDPSGNPNDAWKASWKSLEDLYLSGDYPIASIGLGNFQLDEIESMKSFARVKPHMLQLSVWSLIYDYHLINFCHQNDIHIQVHNALSDTVSVPERAPYAFQRMMSVADEISTRMTDAVTPGQVVLAWLLQNGVSVVPESSLFTQVKENSAVSMMNFPMLNNTQIQNIAWAMEAYLRGREEPDVNVDVSFHVVSKDVMLYWKDESGNEVHVAYLQRGETYNETTYPNHVYRAYDALNMDDFEDHRIGTQVSGKTLDVDL